MSAGCNYSKLKTNLRLAINCLKLLEKEKTELAQKSRKEIADYLANGKIDLSKIRVEHIIREDYLVEAMEVVEMYCDLLLARFGLVQQMKTLDEGLAEAISSLMWAAPRLQTDVAELKYIADQLAVKYGKQYALAARENALNSVNEKLVHKLSVQAPPKILVEKYLIDIAKSHNVPYEPDSEILAEEVDEAISNVPLIELDDTKPPEPEFVSGLPDKSMYPGIQYPQPDLPKLFNFPVSHVSYKRLCKTKELYLNAPTNSSIEIESATSRLTFAKISLLVASIMDGIDKPIQKEIQSNPSKEAVLKAVFEASSEQKFSCDVSAPKSPLKQKKNDEDIAQKAIDDLSEYLRNLESSNVSHKSQRKRKPNMMDSADIMQPFKKEKTSTVRCSAHSEVPKKSRKTKAALH